MMMLVAAFNGTHAYIFADQVAAVVGIQGRDGTSNVFLKGGEKIAVEVGPDKMAERVVEELKRAKTG